MQIDQNRMVPAKRQFQIFCEGLFQLAHVKQRIIFMKVVIEGHISTYFVGEND